MLIDFIDCEAGDSFDNITKMYMIPKVSFSFCSCDPCPANSYSLDDPYQFKDCKRCPENAECPGGSKIVPLPSFWRYDMMTTKILKCPESSACLFDLILLLS